MPPGTNKSISDLFTGSYAVYLSICRHKFDFVLKEVLRDFPLSPKAKCGTVT
jgi:hypothetical protein